uniref:Uncharacterized protein n=1 Tax=Meloidogyne hapla TaxID=6305 RepID=A0A1I8BMH6_MELHA
MPFDVNFIMITEKTLLELTKRGPLPQMDDTLIEKINRNKYRNATKLDEILNQEKQLETTIKPFIATTKFLTKITIKSTTASTTSQTPFKTTKKQIKTTKQTTTRIATKTSKIEKQTTENIVVKTSTETAKQTIKPEQNKNIKTSEETTKTPELPQQTKTTGKVNSGLSVHSIPIREKGENIIEEEGEQLGDYIYVDDPLMQEPLTLEEEFEDDEEHNLVPLPGEELEEKEEEEVKEKQTESQSLNSAILRKGIEKWILILFTILYFKIFR